MGNGEMREMRKMREMGEERITNAQCPMPNAQCPINQIVMKVKCQVLGHWQ
ncbi:hypothetical protein [Nostoc sp.]|uniref:hypothetical protein n=1 Tax=Nostoc sp. TaxID=1180 RepID=UPI002FF998D8